VHGSMFSGMGFHLLGASFVTPPARGAKVLMYYQ
jgi:hypothetical protein